jgi:hypothetical protein
MAPCPVTPTDDILGSLGSLIAVDNPAVQEVVSWALAGNMEIIITRSRAAAMSCKVSSVRCALETSLQMFSCRSLMNLCPQPHRVIPLETVNSDARLREKVLPLVAKHGGLHILNYIRPLVACHACFKANSCLTQVYTEPPQRVYASPRAVLRPLSCLPHR